MFGVTSPISLAMPRSEDIFRTNQLENVLQKNNVFSSDEELAHRADVISKLNKIFKMWVKTTSLKKLTAEDADVVSGKLYVFGSCQLGVQNKGSDVDVLCVMPRHIERSEFFCSFVELLKKQKEIKDLRAIEDAYVPVIKMEFDNIEIDMLCARMALKDIPENQDLMDINLLKNLHPKCVRSLNGYRITQELFHIIPNLKNFKVTLRSVKLWAKRQGIYSNILGYLGGCSWSILVARTCQLYPNATSATLMQKFFFVFSQWPWPKPVHLKHPEENKLGLDVWDPRLNIEDRLHLMPILTPAYPAKNSAFNVSYSTRTIMQDSFKDGLAIVDGIMTGRISWEKLFEPTNFFTKYKHFIVLIASALTKNDHLEWCGLVESKIRLLISSLEEHPNITIAHVNTEKFTPLEVAPDTYQCMWFIGLQFSKTRSAREDFTHDIQKFNDILMRQASRSVYKKGMKIEAKHVHRKELSKYLPASVLSKNKKEKVNVNVNAGNENDTKANINNKASSSSVTAKIHNHVESPNAKHAQANELDSNSINNAVKKRPLDNSDEIDSSLPKLQSYERKCSALFAQKKIQLPVLKSRDNDSTTDESQLNSNFQKRVLKELQVVEPLTKRQCLNMPNNLDTTLRKGR